MIYWILSDMGVKHGRRHDGNWEPLSKRTPASDEVTRYHRYRDAVAVAKKLKKKDCHCKPLKQEGVVLYWRLPAEAGESDLAEVIEFRSRRQADAWRKRAEAEGCEVIECLGVARPAKRKREARA
jgi:hypothetical protein